MLLLTVTYLGFLYGLYVPDWQYVVQSDSSVMTAHSTYIYMVRTKKPSLSLSLHLYTYIYISDTQFVKPQVKCSVRGDLSPACNSAGMIDRHILGFDHLYAKPVYRNLKVSFIRILCTLNLRFYTIYSLMHKPPL